MVTAVTLNMQPLIDTTQQKNFQVGWMDPWWSDQHRDLDYTHEPFNNVQDQDRWRNLGFTQQRFTGDLYDMRRQEPSWIKRFRDTFSMRNFSWAIYRMRPGDVLPNHSDTYVTFRKIYKLRDDAIIRRYVVFLEDWLSGHYFEIDGVPVTAWRQGTFVSWHNDTFHLAANMGETDRYTVQLTGVIDND